MAQPPKPQVQPCRYKTGKTLGAGSYSVVKECVHIDTGRYYAAKVINKRLMAGREHMVGQPIFKARDRDAWALGSRAYNMMVIGPK
jgi:serine/threonine protein kinase